MTEIAESQEIINANGWSTRATLDAIGEGESEFTMTSYQLCIESGCVAGFDTNFGASENCESDFNRPGFP